MSAAGESMLAGLLDACHTVSMDELPDLVREHAAAAGLHRARIYLADLQEDVLRSLTGQGLDGAQGGEGEPVIPIVGSPAGRSFTTLTPVSELDGDRRWWVPLLDGAERVGVLRLDTRDDGSPDTTAMGRLATLVTMMIMTKRAYSDSYARRVRTRPMNVAAEMQWNLMPPRAFANGHITIAAALEPAYEIGGDAFDYALADDTVHLGIFDAMGHDVAAGLASNLAVAACRNSRRQGAGLVETGRAIEKALVENLGGSARFVTALLAELNLRTGEVSWVNHGHPSPVVIRDGHWTGLKSCPPGAPLGTDLGVEATLCHERLGPGDRLVLYTDGVTETRDRSGEEFGLNRFVNFILRLNAEGLPVPETLRRLVHSVLDYHGGKLQDDATVLFLEWHGPHPREVGDTPMGLVSRHI
jgi:hypothetical protein